MLLDLRTLKSIPKSQHEEHREVFYSAYVNFALQCALYDKPLVAPPTTVLHTEQRPAEDHDDKRQKKSHESLKSGHEYGANSWSDEEDDDGDMMDIDVQAELKKEAEKVFKNWTKLKINWRALFQELDTNDSEEKPDLFALYPLDIGRVYKMFTEMPAEGTTNPFYDPERERFGWIPLMACCSQGQLGALTAESFCERLISIANDVLDEGNTKLSDEEIEMLTLLKANRKFMDYMRTSSKYKSSLMEQFGKTIINESQDDQD